MKRAALLVVAMAAAGVGCVRPNAVDSIETVALVDGHPVALASFRTYFEANAGRPIAESRPAVVSGLFDQFLREEAWRREAGLSTADEAADRRSAPAMLLSRAGDTVKPTDAEIAEEYDRHPERYRRPEEARAARIFTRARPEADRARSQVSAGEDFAEVARKVSRSPDASRGGAVGWVARGDLPAEFEQAVFRLKPGEISPVIATEEGFLIFTVLERRPARTLSREEAEPEIRQRLAREKAERYLEGLVETARRERRIRVFADRLPFVYAGSFVSPGKESR